MAIAGGACQSIALWLDESGALKRGAVMMRQASICVEPPYEAAEKLRSGARIYLRLRGDELLRLMRLLEDA
jgi:hypothetical protein